MLKDLAKPYIARKMDVKEQLKQYRRLYKAMLRIMAEENKGQDLKDLTRENGGTYHEFCFYSLFVQSNQNRTLSEIAQVMGVDEDLKASLLTKNSMTPNLGNYKIMTENNPIMGLLVRTTVKMVVGHLQKYKNVGAVCRQLLK